MRNFQREIGGKTNADEIFGKAYDRNVLKKLWPYIIRYKLLVFLSVLAMLAYTFAQVSLPLIIKHAIDVYVENKNTQGLQTTFYLFILTGSIIGISNYAQQYLIARAGQKILYDLRHDTFKHLQKLPMHFYNSTETGRIMSRMMGDVFQLQEFLNIVISAATDIFVLSGIIFAMTIISPKLALLAMLATPILILSLFIWQPIAIKTYVSARRAVSGVNSNLNQNLTGIRAVQSMNRQKINMNIFEKLNLENQASMNKSAAISAVIGPIIEVLSAISAGLILFFGSQMITSNAIEIGTLVAMILYIERFYGPIRNITQHYTMLQRSMASGARIVELLETPIEKQASPSNPKLPILKGSLEIKNLNYSYPNSQQILKNINLSIQPGQTVALVGETGSGKSTLISLITRLYEIEKKDGEILIDGFQINQITKKSLLDQISIVLQDPFLFSGTISENIKYNRPEMPDEEMIAATKTINAHQFISELENGYQTFLHEKGENLSIGQRQLISFARAIAHNPRLLILDEATASIDSKFENLIQSALEILLKGRTAIVIAHRLSTIRNSDKIVVLKNGEIAEQGNHDELIKHKGIYADLSKIHSTNNQTN